MAAEIFLFLEKPNRLPEFQIIYLCLKVSKPQTMDTVAKDTVVLSKVDADPVDLPADPATVANNGYALATPNAAPIAATPMTSTSVCEIQENEEVFVNEPKMVAKEETTNLIEKPPPEVNKSTYVIDVIVFRIQKK